MLENSYMCGEGKKIIICVAGLWVPHKCLRVGVPVPFRFPNPLLVPCGECNQVNKETPGAKMKLDNWDKVSKED